MKGMLSPQDIAWEIWMNDPNVTKEYLERCQEPCLAMYKRTKLDKWKDFSILCGSKKVFGIIANIHFDREEYTKAAEYFEKGRERGALDTTDVSNLGFCYGFGIYPPNHQKAIECYIHTLDDPVAMNNISRMYYSTDQIDLAKKYATMAVDKGVQCGWGVLADIEPDGKTKLEMYEKAGTNYGRKMMGEIYLYGLHGIQHSYEKALNLFRLSTDTQNKATWYLAAMYSHGYGVNRDTTKAFELFSDIDSLEYLDMYSMALMMYTGNGTKKDRKKAIAVFETSLFPKSMNEMGTMYFMGTKETPQNNQIARDWFNKALACNDPVESAIAHFGLGLIASDKTAQRTHYDHVASLVYTPSLKMFPSQIFQIGIIMYRVSRRCPDYLETTKTWFQHATNYGCLNSQGILEMLKIDETVRQEQDTPPNASSSSDASPMKRACI
jgi:TPR repeat protein